MPLRSHPVTNTAGLGHRSDAHETPTAEELEQALLLGRFVVAFEGGQPGPCPVCGDVMRPSDWPAHVLSHR
jgi:hypothetical protein